MNRVFVLLCLYSLGLSAPGVLAATAPPPVTKPTQPTPTQPTKPTTPVPSGPSAPTPAPGPAFPNSPFNSNNNPPQQPSSPDPDPAPIVSDPAPEVVATPIPITMLKNPKPKVIKPYMRAAAFVTSGEVVFRSAPNFVSASSSEKPNVITAPMVMLDTAEKEAENDALISKHEYENSLQLIDVNRRLYQKMLQLYQKQVVTRQEYENALTTLQKSEGTAEQSKNLWAEYEAEASLDKLRLSQMQGAVVTLSDLVKGYVHLWSVRVDKAKGALIQAQADNDYLSANYARNQQLKAKGAIADADLILSERDANQAAIILRLAQEAVAQNQKFLQEVEDQLKAAEQLESDAAPAPSRSDSLM